MDGRGGKGRKEGTIDDDQTRFCLADVFIGRMHVRAVIIGITPVSLEGSPTGDDGLGYAR